MSTFIVVGAGLAGAKAAQTLREEGFDGRVVLLGEEDARPYDRPPLSKEVLRGDKDEDAIYLHAASFYDEQDIELRTETRVQSLALDAREVELDGGERLRWDRLLLATGARPRRLRIPGADLDGIVQLRTLADCMALRDGLQPGVRLAIVGAGWIGCEVAASARELGAEVSLIEPCATPLERVLGAEIGGIYRDLHAEHGVRLLLGRGVAAFEGERAIGGVRTDDGTVVGCDLAVVGVGVTPCAELAEQAGVKVANGIVVDEHLQTSVPGVYAAGDVASARHPLYAHSLRVEHWANALHQGPVAARNMLGEECAYSRVPYFFSDQYDVGMEYAGYAPTWDEVVVRGDAASRELVAFWLRDGRLLAGMNVNVWDVTDDIQALIRAGEPVDRRRLADPDVPLADLLPASVRPG
jgi:3-phenylpropionate/trans-cinnamate dioxygenase ferredoxin reductase subunit